VFSQTAEYALLAVVHLANAVNDGVRVSISVIPGEKPMAATVLSTKHEDGVAAATNAAGKIRIVLVDDHQVVREGSTQLLEREADLEVIGQAQDGRSAITLVESLLPDVVLRDVNMPGMSGIEATRQSNR
jgi:PleD family two-component response regulator